MHLESARELKQALRGRVAATYDNGPEVALGIAPRERGDFALAVRLRNDVDADSFLAQVAEESHGELDVRTVGVIRALGSPVEPGDLQSRQRPVFPGVSIGHPDVSAGTLGGFVLDDGRAHALSNSHVLADSGQASIGDAVVQPGAADGGRVPEDQIGTLAAFAPLSLDGVNLVDAALAALDEGVECDPGRYPGGAVCGVADGPPQDGQVEKVGRTTGLTAGVVTAFEVDGVRVQYDIGVLTFNDQIEIEGAGADAFSAGGDSGSVIWALTDREAFGLLFAGSSIGGTNGQGLTYANVMRTVLTEFDASWLGGAS